MNKKNLYDYDVTTVRQFGEHITRVVHLSACRRPDIEIDKSHVPKGTVNDSKLENNLSRAKAKVRELAWCNPWVYWCTFTLNPAKFDRYNLKAYKIAMGEFFHNFNRNRPADKKVKYLLVPEMHEDGAWHMHGFMLGLSDEDLYVNANGYLSWKAYEEKFGFISMSKIKDLDKASSYILKYMTKDSSRNVSALGEHLYMASKGLQKSELIFKGRAILHTDWDWEHPDGHCRVKTFDDRKEDIAEFLEVTG